MSGFHILLIIVSAFILFHLLKRIFAKGNIEEGFFVEHNKEPFLYLLLDYETSDMSKGGITAYHLYKLKKINLKEQSIEYEVKITSFASGMLDGYIKVFGMNENFLFIRTYNHDLVIINNKTGKRQCNLKQIVKKNPGLVDFNLDLCQYSHVLQSIVIYDNQGYAQLLNPETCIAKRIDFNISAADQIRSPTSFTDLPNVNLYQNYIVSGEPNSFFAGSNKYDVDFIAEEGSKRYFVHIKTNFSNEKPKQLEQSFLSPKIMGRGTSIKPFLTKNPPSVAIIHAQNLNPKISDIYISRVNAKSKELWKLALTEIVYKPKFSKDSYLYFTVNNKKIYFIYKKTASHKISMSVIDKYSGKVIKRPKLFANSRI
ncbi:MAG: hypothetical protein B6I20_04345 [Bacteroidetes bacterium 4572_117]|nr:MAG: hypothetical protein B6I20_04345 [Bacteroidetes bacterium 4572_117]